ncbi:MAG: Glycerol-3-phosphate regulon repressor [Gammaproteobacteria bacterium]|nr:Glycerol-3-phosphate regulon repressor [Gammaproteobacteria bacterium]
MGTTRLTREERQKRILQIARARGSVRVNALAETFDVTGETMRRDLDGLCERGLLHRTYGGAAALSLTHEPQVWDRQRSRVNERQRIGQYAADLVDPGDAIFVDCGSTTTFFARALAARAIKVTVVTNCIPAASELGPAEEARVILCPGEYVAGEGGVYGPETIEFITRYTVDKTFIGSGGLTVEGPTDADTRSVWIKRAMLERSERALLLVDSSKFDLHQFEVIGPLSRFSDVVSDRAPRAGLINALKKDGVGLHEATSTALFAP